MINFENTCILQGMLSGVDDSLLDFVTKESNSRRLVELEQGYLEELEVLDEIPLQRSKRSNRIE